MNETMHNIVIYLMFMIIGVLLTIFYQQMNYSRTYNGLRIGGNLTHEKALAMAYSYDGGDWVCANVRGMKYNECVETCQHECAHEIFAEILEKSPEKINDVMKVLNES